MGFVPDPSVKDFAGIQRNFDRIGEFEFVGSGDPEGVVTAKAGATYRRADGGAGSSLYVKETPDGSTGWAAK
jgi:hypothetical protein